MLLGGVGGSSNAHSHRLSNESTSKTILVLLLRVSDCSLEGKRDIADIIMLKILMGRWGDDSGLVSRGSSVCNHKHSYKRKEREI